MWDPVVEVVIVMDEPGSEDGTTVIAAGVALLRFCGSAMRIPHVQGAFRQVLVREEAQAF